MKELSLHILDIVQNSVVAKATRIEVEVIEDEKKNIFQFSIKDNGVGMNRKMLEKVIDPYTTTRTTRRVGMGLPLLNDACRLSGGRLQVVSQQGKGTEIKAEFELNHVDRQPLGDIAGVMALLFSSYPQIHFIYQHKRNGNQFGLDTQEVLEALDGVPINSPDVTKLLKEMVSLNLDEL